MLRNDVLALLRKVIATRHVPSYRPERLECEDISARPACTGKIGSHNSPGHSEYGRSSDGRPSIFGRATKGNTTEGLAKTYACGALSIGRNSRDRLSKFPGVTN